MGILKWVLIAIAVLVGIGAIIYGVGMSVPERHVARAERVIAMSTDAVAQRIRDVRAYPAWREGAAVSDVEEAEGAITYVETMDGDRIAFRMTEPEPGRRFVSVITDDTLPFGGQWTFTLTPEGESTRVAIQEDGVVRDPLYRFFARFVFGYESTLNGYLDALEASAR